MLQAIRHLCRDNFDLDTHTEDTILRGGAHFVIAHYRPSSSSSIITARSGHETCVSACSILRFTLLWRENINGPGWIPLRKMHLYVSLCLSRACLGKMIISSIKWRKRCVLSHQLWSGYPSVVVSEKIPGPPASPSVKARMHEEALQKAFFGSTFPYICPEPVLVNSSISHGHSSNMADSAPACLHSARPPPAETLFSSFPTYVCTFVPSLSWQVFGFQNYKMAHRHVSAPLHPRGQSLSWDRPSGSLASPQAETRPVHRWCCGTESTGRVSSHGTRSGDCLQKETVFLWSAFPRLVPSLSW
jgi:hypothetical protein